MLRFIHISLFLLLTLGVRAQAPYMNKALDAYQASDIVKAAGYIDSAIANPDEAKDPFTWHLRGFIYRDYFRVVEKENRNSNKRPIAIESFMKSNELEGNNGENTAKNNSNIKSLIISYYNNAVVLMDTAHYRESEKFYVEYRNWMLRAFPATDLKKQDVDYYNALATILVKLYNHVDHHSEKYFDSAVAVYKKVIELDSNNCLAHYQIGILYYNKGVEILLGLEAGTPLEEIVKAQDECVRLFLISKPHLYRAWQIENCQSIDKVEIATGISGIHYQLNEAEEHQRFEEIKKKLQEGKNE